jgi:UDP-glucose 4-epimerase
VRIAVTGGAGFIGSHVADALLQAGHQVLVIDDLSSGRRENVPRDAGFARIDIRDAAELLAAVGDFRPQAVSHQAAQVSVPASAREPVRDAEINVLGSLNLLEASIRHGVQRLVFASSGGAIYGEVPEGRSADVQWPLRPLSPYGCAKLAVERYLDFYRQEHGLLSTVLRYANVYGPRQDPYGEAGVVAIFSANLLRGEPIQVNARARTGDPGCVRDYVFVDDVVKANLAALEGRLDGRVVNVGTGRATTTLELARMVERAAGVTASILFGPRRVGDLERSVLDLGEDNPVDPPTPLELGIEQTVAWFRDPVRGS